MFIQLNRGNGQVVAASTNASALTSHSGTVGQDRKRSADGGGSCDGLQPSKHQKRSTHTASVAALPTSSTNNNNAQIKITIHFDGGSRGNPGVAGAGAHMVIVDKRNDFSSTTIYIKIREYCGPSRTNNYAEYKGLIVGLQQVKTYIEQFNRTKKDPYQRDATALIFQLNIYGDSKLVIEQLRGNWKCKHPNLQPLYAHCQALVTSITNLGNIIVRFDHVYREQNKDADLLANEAMDEKRSWTTRESTATPVPVNDQPNDERKPSAVAKEKEIIDVDEDNNDTDSSYEC